MEKWSSVDKDNMHLATIRVYNKDPKSGKQRIVLLVNAETPEGEVEEFEMDMVNEEVDNQIVVAEREKEPGSRARTTILTGRVKHECNLRPVFNESYRQRMRERNRAANTPVRQTRLIDEVMTGNRGGINMLSSGVTSSNTFSTLVVRRQPVSQQSYRAHDSAFRRKRSRNPSKALSRGLLVCHAINYWTCSSGCIAKGLVGLQRICGREQNNLKHI